MNPSPTPPSAAILARPHDLALRLTHDGIVYDGIPGDAALGALLFTLRPASVAFTGARASDQLPLRLSVATARQFAALLQKLASRTDRAQAGLPAHVDAGAARAWLQAAVATVPHDEQPRFAWRAARRLGEDPWGDGSPAVTLSQEQLALFEAGFADDEGHDGAAPPPA